MELMDLDDGPYSDPPAVRCCNCGNIEDPVIQINRFRSTMLTHCSAEGSRDWLGDVQSVQHKKIRGRKGGFRVRLRKKNPAGR